MESFTNSNTSDDDNKIKLSDSLKSILLKDLTGLFPEENSENLKKLQDLVTLISGEVITATSNSLLCQKMEILYQYEKHYLDILKEYKEEIKFAASLQEDIRKERARFFAETLKEVSATLKTTDVDKTVINEWIKDLVQSYTKSLDASSLLATEQVQEILGDIQKDSKETINQATNSNI